MREALSNKNPDAEYRNPWPRPDPKGRVLYDSFPNIPETAAYFKLVAPIIVPYGRQDVIIMISFRCVEVEEDRLFSPKMKVHSLI